MAMLCCYITMSAQLAWNTKFDKAAFEDAQTLISKSENVKYEEGILGIGAGLKLGKTIVAIPIVNPNPDPYKDEAVIALQRTGIADSVSFNWSGRSGVTFTVYQSVDHNKWTAVWTVEGTGSVVAGSGTVTMPLSPSARYLKFEATGKSEATYKDIMASDQSALSVNTDERVFGHGIVGDEPETKAISITWTSIVANVTSTDEHFTTDVQTIGRKAEAGKENEAVDQTSTINISYLHTDAGEHTGYIVISGEGKEVRVAVSGSTEKAHPEIGVKVERITYGKALKDVVVTDTIGKVPGSFSFVDVSADSVFDAGEYELEVLFTPENTNNYYSETCPVTLIVDKAVQVVEWDEQDSIIVIGDPLPLTARLSSGEPVTYAFTAGILDIDPLQQAANGTKAGEVQIVAFHEGGRNYLPTIVAVRRFTVVDNETGIKQLTSEQIRSTQKCIEGGRVIILRDEQAYDAQGRRIR